MYASYTFMNDDVGMPNTTYLKKLTDVQDTYEQK
ncbi:MAG: hypothetical protein CM15mV51_1230 [uncultured marine virus]|nr:MAG: hypothetical protein CM15mV51_1230 [uncultured marine virus]